MKRLNRDFIIMERTPLRPFTILLTFLLIACACTVCAEYRVPDYPQTPSLVNSISVQVPEQAQIGESIDVKFIADFAVPVPDDARMYFYLVKDAKVYSVSVIEVSEREQVGRKPGRMNFGPYKVDIPAGLVPGDYECRAGFYKDGSVALANIVLTGPEPKFDPLIITTGCFVDKYGVPHYWHINKAHTLFWDGKPFIPAGGMFIYDRDWNLVKAQLDILKKYGVKNIYLHLGVNQPYVWKDYSDDDYAYFQKTIDYLDDNGFTYGIEFQALEAKGYGYSYPGGGARIDHVKTSGKVRAEEKEARSAVFLVHDNATGKVVQTGIAKVDGNFLEADVVVPKEGDYRVVFAADRPGPNDYTMYWWDDKYHEYEKKVRSHYSRVKLGPGFRFLVDPLWNEMNNNHGFVPSAPDFADQFTQWLEKRYGTIEELNKAWAPVGAGWPTFSAAGSTISIERIDDKTSGRLMQYAYSRSAKRFYTMEACASQFNYDMREFIGRSLLHYCNDIANVFKRMNDVPVIYKGFSDVDWWHINDTGLASGHDGLGMESYGNGEPMLQFMGAHIYGECEQATKTTWLIVTETGEGNHQDACLSRNKTIGYTDRLGTMYANYNALISGGAKGIYQYNMIGGRGCQDPWTDNISRDPRQLEWLATYDRILANATNLVDYRPPAYYRFPGLFNPCSMELCSEPCGDFYNMGGWWWREPVGKSQNNLWILPSFSLRPDAPMFLVNLENKPATVRFAEELTDAVDAGRRITMIGFRKDLGTLPVVDKYYTGKFSTNDRGRKFQVLRPTPNSRILNKTASGEVWNLIDGNLQINSEEVFGRHGYSPENLVIGDERPVEPYYGVFERLLGVQLLDLGPELTGFMFQDGGKTVTVISAVDKPQELNVSLSNATTCRFADGTPAGENSSDGVVVELAPVEKKLVPAKLDFAPEGIMIDSTNCRETVIIEGEPVALSTAQEAVTGPKPVYIWIEGEDAISHNYNYARMGGIPTLSGGAFLGLETAVEPPSDTGWYATYEFDAPTDGTYQLWLRENYLSFSSPSSCRIDNGKWMHAPNTFVPVDTEVVALYNAVEDERQIFAWYHYGAVDLSAEKHTLTFRVDQPRPRGTLLTMANDRPYAKLIDCIMLAQGDFTPNGTAKPQSLSQSARPPLLNLLPDPSIEFDTDGDEKCDHWTASEKDGLEWTRPGWGNIRLEGLFDINLGLKDAYAEMRALKIISGEKERSWTSVQMKLDDFNKFLAGGWVRKDPSNVPTQLEIQWLDAGDRLLKTDTLRAPAADTEWHEVTAELVRPTGATHAAIRCVVSPADKGTAWFDDMYFAGLGSDPESR